jgi:hypothetical protein
MTAQAIEDLVYSWFEARFPGRPDPGCHESVPAEVRAIIFTSIVEGEISNGGLPQLLWNTFEQWRAVLNDAEMGYRLFGAAQHEEAIRDFRSLFMAFEDECRRYIGQSTCGEWCGHGYRVMKSAHEDLFFTEKGLQLRQAWIASNGDQVLALLKSPTNSVE